MGSKSVQDVLQTAFDLHRGGNIQEAERMYLRVLAAVPEHPLALQHLGIIAVQCGKPEVGAKLIRRATELAPSAVGFVNLGEALRSMNRLPEAAQCYRQALLRDAKNVDAIANLGLTLNGLQQFAEAEAMLRRALSEAPNHVTALVGMADVFVATERHDEALAMWERLTRMSPQSGSFRRSLGNVWLYAGDPYRAITCFRRAIDLNPKDVDSYRNLVVAYDRLKNYPAAVEAARATVELFGDAWQSHFDLALALQKADKAEDAVGEYARALELDPSMPMLYGASGTALITVGRLAEAADVLQRGTQFASDDSKLWSALSALKFTQGEYDLSAEAARHAVTADPKSADSHSCLAFALLAAGNFEEGFKEYEWRWRDVAFASKPRDFDRPMWSGSDPAGRTILIHSEQGFGDIFQFLRYVPMLVALGATVIVETHHKIAELVRRMPGSATVFAQGARLPDFDMHVPMMSLPWIFRTTISTVPACGPYLSANPSLIKEWRKRIEPIDGLVVGLVWAGNLKPDPKRSATLADLGPLNAVTGVTLLSLQAHGNEADSPPAGMRLRNIGPELRDFSDTTASVMANLDLLITIDTGAAHLAAAMGVQTWIMLPHSADWRWSQGVSTTAWYSTVRLFRQPARDDWASVVQEVKNELQLLSHSQRAVTQRQTVLP